MTFPTLTASQSSQEEWNRRAKDVVNAHSNAFRASGTTALRPTKNLYIGQFYFDTTLGQPIWWNDPDWVDATGAPA